MWSSVVGTERSYFIIVFPSFSSLYLLPVLWCESFLVVIVGIPVFFGTVRETMHLFFLFEHVDD